MFIACPHCRELVAPHPLTRQLPPTCPRCGGNLPNARATVATPGAANTADSDSDAAAAPSLVTLLRPANAEEHSSTAPQKISDTDVDSPAARAGDSVVEPKMSAPGAANTNTDAPTQSPIIDTRAEADGHATTQPDSGIAAGVEAEPTIESSSAVASTGASPLAATAPTDVAAAKPADMSPRSPPAVDAAKATGHPHSPSFLQRQRIAKPAPSPARWQWAVVVALVAVLVLQVLLADRERLVADAGWRPLIGGLCGMLGCSMPAWREPQAMTMIDRDVRPLAETPGVLLAKATFRNDARWAQPWPVVLLTLKDADGRSVGARALAPADYLDTTAETHIAPGQTAEITVQVREPSASVVAFAFDFH